MGAARQVKSPNGGAHADHKRIVKPGVKSVKGETFEEYKIIKGNVSRYQENQPDRIIALFEGLKGLYGGFQVDQMEHALQLATRLEEAGASEELIVCGLCHDLGKVISWINHPAITAEILRPYVSPTNVWIVLNHQDFQGRYFLAYGGGDNDTYLQHKDHPGFKDAILFGELDATTFQADYPTKPFSHFEPMIRRVFGKEREKLSVDY